MRILRLIISTIFLFAFVSSFAQSELANSKRESSQIHIYKIGKDDLRKVHLKEDGFDENMLKTFVTKYDVGKEMPSLSRGNYVRVSVVENQLSYTELTIDDLYAKVIPSDKFVICLYDSLGNIISDAQVRKGSAKLKFDERTQTYIINKVKNEDIVEIVHDGVYHYLEVENDEYHNRSYNIFESTWWKIKSLWYKTKNGVNDILYPSERPLKQKYTGFIVFNKPKYKPGETVKLKAYLSERNGKRYNKPIDLRLRESHYPLDVDTILTRLEPYQLGMYNYEFKLTEELDLMLDEYYRISLVTNEKNTNWLEGSFRYEEYELKSINFSMTSEKNEFAIGDSIKLKLKVADENEMAVYDGKVEVLVKPESLDQNKMENMKAVFIPDTLWFQAVDLTGISEKEIVLPDSIFSFDTPIRFKVQATYLSADNEKHTEVLSLNRLGTRYTLDFSMNKGILNIKELYLGESQSTVAKISIRGADGQSLYCDSVMLPHSLSTPWMAEDITVETKNIKGYYSFDDEKEDQIGYKFYRANDSIYLKVENPTNIPFWYTIRKMKDEIAKGYTTQLNYTIKDRGDDGYSMQLVYLFGGKSESIESSLPFVQKNITMDVTTPTTVYPGQKANVQIAVTDKKGQPVKDADVTAYSFTSKFNKYSMPNIAIEGKVRYAKQFSNARYDIDDDLYYNSKSNMTWNKWLNSMDLDTIEYYKFLYPENYYVYKDPTNDGTTQISPFVVIDGEVQGVHLLWIDNRLYYSKQAEHLEVYSFEISPGKHNLRFRTHDREVFVSNLHLEKGKKHIVSFNAGKPYVSIPYDDPTLTPFVLTSRLLDKEERNYLSEKEVAELHSQLVTINNNFGKIELPNIQRTIEVPGFLATGNTLYYLNQTPRIKYDNTLRANINKPILVGPFPQRSFMNGLSNIASVYGDGRLLANIQIEDASLYTLYPNYQKIEQWDKSVINRSIYPFKPTLNFSQQLLTTKDIEKEVERQIESVMRSTSGFADYRRYKEGINFKNYYLNLTLGRDSAGATIVPTLIFVEPRKDESRKDYQLYYGNTRMFDRLPTEELTIHLIFNDSTSYSHPIKLYEGGKNYLKLDSICYEKNSKIARTAYNLFNRGIKRNYVENPYITASVKDTLILSSLFDEEKFIKENKDRRVVSGIVRDKSEPIIGAIVRIKGTNKGVTTDFDGKFEIEVNDYATLEAMFIGYNTKEIKVSAGHDYNIVMQEDNNRLDEIVVVGYGAVKRSYLTSSVVAIHDNSLGFFDSGILQGKIAGVMVRGVGGVKAESKPLIIVNGLPFDGNLEDLDPSTFLSINVLKDASATSIYGARAANGVIMIESNTLNSLLTANVDGGLSEEAGNSMRRNFHDDAFWQPKLKTNAKGEVNFEVTYPDDITNWKAYFIALGGKKQADTKEMNIRSFKALSAKLSIPHFAINGDSFSAVGRVANHLGDSLQLTRTIEIDDKKQIDKIKIGNSHIDYIPLNVADRDSLTLAYSLQMENGYFDGEERSLPILRQGMLQTYGDFRVINDSATYTLNTDPALGSITVHAEASSLELFLREIDNIDRYPYLCNEQMASKIKALLAKKYIYKLQDKKFEEDKKINGLIRDINKNKNKNGLWGWWNKSESVMWISKHVMNALLDAEDAGYRTQLDKYSFAKAIEKELQNSLSNLPLVADPKIPFAKGELLDRLVLLKRLDASIDYKSYFQQIDSQLSSKLIKDKLKDMLVMSTIGMQDSVKMDSLMHYSSKTILGSLYWENDKNNNLHSSYFYRPNETNIENTLMAYQILKNIGKHETDLERIASYFFEQRKNNTWNNTYEASRIIQTIMPDMLNQADRYSNVVMDINGNKISKFPYTIELEPKETIRVSKLGTMPLFVSAYQREWNKNPIKEGSKGFEITTVFKMNDNIVADLKEGKSTTLQAILNLKGDAEYVQIEIPIPAGCSYESKLKGSYWKETHREHYKEKVVIFCDKLSKGEHVFNIELLPRYTGKYTLNPAKVELMYFPTFYGNEKVKTTLIR